jgi:hypothetical protein
MDQHQVTSDLAMGEGLDPKGVLLTETLKGF